ncbi:hypothetical protein [Flavobacterium piscis]|uniref:DKNYY family protein n=1 Tax=Flavobacterium piscis TaxID=1114874 RepID=A0ABU1YH54_9FLAO|nr:hypothetical protein [Flavobacterium piscis]MDR7212746.1 hypothetical protein [Flavobacterium piscis]
MKISIQILLSLFFLNTLKAQEKEKDTLYFGIDKHYTISPTITPNLGFKITYSERLERNKEQMKHTKTNGYIFFVGNGYLVKGLKPKKIFSLKEYIENRKFYFDGKYNQIVDKWKLKDSLTDKYTIFFVNGDEFIQPRDLEYDSYYPMRDADWNLIENKVKDTLVFNYDTKYIQTYVKTPKQYYLNDSSGGSNGSFFFREKSFVNNLETKELLSLQEFVQSSRFYNKDKKQKLDDLKLAEYFNNYIVFLVRKNSKETEYIQVESSFEIE